MPEGPAIGSLFSGYGGLDLAVQAVFGARTAWVSDVEPGPRLVLAARFPGAPNLGDVAAVDWASVEPVDVMCGGFPCQDMSPAGKRAGLRPGTRSGLWAHMAAAVAAIRPPLVVIENVRGITSAESESDSPVEPCPWCLGGRANPPLRALGAVLGDLADLGYDARWDGLRAADVGACHGRFRIFVLAVRRGAGIPPAAGGPVTAGPPAGAPPLLPTPNTTRRPTTHSGRAAPTPTLEGIAARLLPTPRAADTRASMTAPAAARHLAAGFGSLAETIGALLPTPQAHDSRGAKTAAQVAAGRAKGHGVANLNETVANAGGFGAWLPAMRRWADVMGRDWPPPAEAGPSGRPRLSAPFVEWMMGLPEGWVCDVPGVTRARALRMLGNGVVPLQAETAIRGLADAGARDSEEAA